MVVWPTGEYEEDEEKSLARPRWARQRTTFGHTQRYNEVTHLCRLMYRFSVFYFLCQLRQEALDGRFLQGVNDVQTNARPLARRMPAKLSVAELASTSRHTQLDIPIDS